MTLRTFVVLAALAASGAGRAQEPKPHVSATPDAPRIAVEPASFDFGAALPDKTLRKEFQIRNFGGADLEIESVSTTCGCTAALTETRTLKPGASATLRVTLETRKASGPLRKAVLIRSNDPVHALVEIKLQATVQAEKAPAR